MYLGKSVRSLNSYWIWSQFVRVRIGHYQTWKRLSSNTTPTFIISQYLMSAPFLRALFTLLWPHKQIAIYWKHYFMSEWNSWFPVTAKLSNGRVWLLSAQLLLTCEWEPAEPWGGSEMPWNSTLHLLLSPDTQGSPFSLLSNANLS